MSTEVKSTLKEEKENCEKEKATGLNGRHDLSWYQSAKRESQSFTIIPEMEIP
jgi:hypothetical protein